MQELVISVLSLGQFVAFILEAVPLTRAFKANEEGSMIEAVFFTS